MPGTARRDLTEEAAKHFQGTPASRLRAARRLGRRALDLFHATLPEGTTLREARMQLEVRKQHGRRRSAAIEGAARMSLVGDVIAYLGKRRVKSALIGGEALAVHGVARATIDSDGNLIREPHARRTAPLQSAASD